MYLENRMIAMLDVLGLSQRLTSKEDLIATSEKYKKLIESVKRTVFVSESTCIKSGRQQVSNFEVGEFVFDNLVLVSHPLSPDSAAKFVFSLIELMREFAVSDMPLRGAVGVGDYCYDEESKVFLSNIFKPLSYEESQQEWAGCVLLPETSAIILQELIGFPEYQEAYNSNLFLKMDVPSKNNMGARWCLNWMHLFSNREIASTMEYISGNATKFQGTRQYLSYLEQLPPNPHLDVKAAEGQNGVAQIKLLVSRASLRIKVADAEGNGIEGVNIDFRVIAQS